MTIYNWLSLLGIPVIGGAIWKAIGSQLKKINAQFEKFTARQTANELGTQALLRDRLYKIFEECKKRGGASLLERENFQNIYDQYHALGANGVMDDIKTKFFALPFREGDL